MKIFMTGSSGFIGKYLTERLSGKHEIIHMVSNLEEYERVNEEISMAQPDIVLHLAARTEVESSFYEHVDFSIINYVGSVNLIEACRKVKNLKLFLFASTMETYGWQEVSDLVKNGKALHWAKDYAFDEQTPQNANAPYAVAKVAVEKYLEYAARSYGLPWAAIRQTNCYGRWDNTFFVMESIISQMIKSDSINLGYSKPYRNFIFIEDLLDFYELMIDNYDKASEGKVFCCGPNNPIRISDLTDIIAKKLNWTGKINWDTRPERPGEIYYLSSKSDKAKEFFGFQHKVNLDEGIDKTIKLWQNQS
tara:strand:- start:509 stop:1426 length:918 start_codon:yes stop_codon:yes gene_type:complete